MTKICASYRGRDLDGFYGRLRRRGLSSTSFRRYHAVLSASLNQAVRWGLVEHSPAAQATPPGLEHNEPAAPSAENIKLLIEDGPGEGFGVLQPFSSWLRRLGAGVASYAPCSGRMWIS